MVAIGIASGLIPLFVFICSWLFGVSTLFLRVVALISLMALLLLWFKRRKDSFQKLTKLRETISRFDLVVIFLILVFMVVNLLGVIAPEIGFDALWYHLTIPKIYLLQGKVDFIPGGLYYYSAMPKLTEIWYMISLAIDKSGTLAKLIHYSYGLGACVLVHRIINRYTNRSYGLVGVLGFISALLVCWESGTAYIDLSWTFYTVLAVYLFLKYFEDKSKIYIILVGIACGLAIGTKLPALFTLIIFYLLLLRREEPENKYYFLTAAVFTSCPWFIFAYLETGNPIYPMFTGYYPPVNPLGDIGLIAYLKSIFSTLTWPQDPLSIFIGFIGISFLFILDRKKTKDDWLLILNVFFIASYFVWFIFFRASGSRFLLPILPVWIILCLIRWYYLGLSNKILYGVLLLSSIVNLGYHALSVSRTFPVIFGIVSRQEYLLARLNFDFGDFYDRDGKIKGIVGDDPVLVYGFHNLFYADFNFVHESTVSDYNAYHYWLSDRPITNCQACDLLYSDPPTKVFLYSFPLFAKIGDTKPTELAALAHLPAGFAEVAQW